MTGHECGALRKALAHGGMAHFQSLSSKQRASHQSIVASANDKHVNWSCSGTAEAPCTAVGESKRQLAPAGGEQFK